MLFTWLTEEWLYIILNDVAFLFIKNYKIKFTHKKETKPILIQIFILTRYQKKKKQKKNISICNLFKTFLHFTHGGLTLGSNSHTRSGNVNIIKQLNSHDS